LAAPSWTRYRIPTDRPSLADGEVGLDALAVGATHEQFYIVWLPTGTAVVPISHCLLTRALLPPVARFLLDVGAEDAARPQSWTWGPLEYLPALPRVRTGRTILCPASWALPVQLTSAATSGPAEEWLDALRRWRDRHQLPSRVVVGIADRMLPLDLDQPVHGLLLRRECALREITRVQEDLAPSSGWLASERGPHVAELVVPILSVDHTRRPAPPLARRAPARASLGVKHLPGSQWLSAHLQVPVRSQNLVLRQLADKLLPHLEDSAVDRWFFVRYHDEAGVPHLRLRFHSSQSRVTQLLQHLNTWTESLLAARLTTGIELATYTPEAERYGGPEALEAVERYFSADSAAVLATLAAEQVGLAGVPVAAVAMSEILQAFDPGETARDWLDRHTAPPSAWQVETTDLIRSGSLAEALGPQVATTWADRRSRATTLGRLVARLDADGQCWSSPARIAESLIHMHANRLFGIAPELERQAIQLARVGIAAGQVRANA
ncbi:MAG: lantibiotic dehydratase, partial [Sporichthyaceae bacterium]|nr:lantibiotic dehydratase [Sporichthyaceae bacterium]